MAVGLILACLVGEATVLWVGIDDLDEGYFVQQALRVVHGQVPYRDFESLYTPGLAYLHAALFGLIGGPFLVVPRALALAGRAALALLLLVITRPLVRQPLWAAMPGLFVLVALDGAPVRWEPHPGWLSTLFAILAAWCLSHRLTPPWLAGAGVATAVAYVFKQNTGAFILAAIVLWPLAPTPGPSPRARGEGVPPTPLRAKNDCASPLVARVFLPLVSFAAVTALWLGPLLLALGGDFTRIGAFVGAVNQTGLFFAPELPVLVPLACLAGGLWLCRRETDRRLRWYLLAGTALFLTQYPRMDALHLVWSAPLLLVSGAVALDRLRPVLAVPILLALAALSGPTIASRLIAVQQPGVPICDISYAAGLQVPETTRADLQGVVAEIQARTQPGAPIFVYPTSPLLYALAERPNPTRFDHLNPDAADAYQLDQVIRDLETSQVRLVVVSDFWAAAWGPPGPNAVLDTWLASHFKEVARFGAYRVLTAGL